MAVMAKTNRPATAALIAERAGVSKTAVSFALNGTAERHRVSKETVERILQVAREMNYVPNSLARSLRRRSTRAIGVLFPHLRNDWAHHMTSGMYRLFDEKGYVLHIVNHRGKSVHEERELASLVERQVDGVLASPLAGSVAHYRAVMKRGVPLVFFGDSLAELPDVSFAAWDPAEVAISVRHLIATGCRRIAYLGFVDERPMTVARRQAFEKTLADAGLEVNRRWIVLNREGQSFESALSEIFDKPHRPDSVFTLYDDTAVDALGILGRLGLRVPEDVSLATLGDSPAIAHGACNVTTTVAPVEAEGYQAAQTLLRLIEKAETGPIHTMVSGGRLEIRGTSHRETANGGAPGGRVSPVAAAPAMASTGAVSPGSSRAAVDDCQAQVSDPPSATRSKPRGRPKRSR